MKKTSEPTYVWLIRNGKKFTTDPNLAVRAAKGTGRKPIEFISERCRDAYRKAYPKLLKKVS